MKINKFEELEVWKVSISVTKQIYSLSGSGKFGTDFGLRDQIRKAIVSVSSNIVEGFEKNNNNEFIRFLRIAKGSVGEVRNQLFISLTLGYISKITFDPINTELLNLANQLGKFIAYLEKTRKQKQFLTR